MSIAVYRGETQPPEDQCHKLTVVPTAWKARRWRASDGGVLDMFRLDCDIRLADLVGSPLHELFTPYREPLRKFALYVERAAAAPLPYQWSVGRITLSPDRCYGWLHRALDDSFGVLLGTLAGMKGNSAEVVISVIPVEAGNGRTELAMADYDIGFGGRFG